MMCPFGGSGPRLKLTIPLLSILGLLLAGMRVQAATPDVLASVEAWSPTQQSVVLTYAHPTSLAEVRRDLDSLAMTTGWPMDSIHVESQATTSGPLYSAEIRTRGAVNPLSGGLPLSPIVTALKRFHHLMVIFDVPAPFRYTGAQNYSDRYVDVTLLSSADRGITYAFQVDVANPSFNKLDMPTISAPAGAAPPVTAGGVAVNGNLTLSHALLALLLAAIVGVLAYVLILRLMLRAETITSS